MKWKPVITELLILLGILLIATVLPIIFIGSLFGNATLDINLHDTYFIIGWWPSIIIPFFVLITLIYLIRVLAAGFSKRTTNTILTISLFGDFLFLLAAYKTALAFDRMMASLPDGETLYPPLSALKSTRKPVHQTLLHQPFSQFIFIILIIFLILLVISAVLTGKNWNTNKHELPKA